MLEKSGINVDLFKAHSKTAASSSTAFKKGVSVWQKHYHRDFSPAESNQNVLLGGALNKD